MTSIPAKERKFSLYDLQEAADESAGFCLACGERHDCCEPDAREYECEHCGAAEVYGAEELVLMGRVA